MRTHFNAFIRGVPKAQPRVRFSPKQGVAYTPKTSTLTWKELIAFATRNLETTGPVRIDWVMVFPRPASHWKKNGTLRGSAPAMHTAKPDRDNLDKAVLDQLKAGGVLKDDSWVTAGELLKRWQRTPSEPVGMYLRISEACEGDPAWIEAKENA